MADDDMTTDLNEDKGTEAAPVVLTADQVTAIVNNALGPVASALRGIHGRVEAMEQGARNPQPGDAADGADLERLVPGLNDHIKRSVMETAKEVIAPLLQPLMDDKVVDLVERHAAKWESEFGEGTWEKYAKADVEKVIQNLPPNQRISARHLNLVVDGLKGRNFEVLSKARTDNTTRRAAENAPLMPNGRPKSSGGPQFSEDETQFFADMAKAGRKVDPKEWATERELGGDEDSWRSYLNKNNGKGAH